MTRSHGPLCLRCGCERDLHRAEIDDSFHLVAAECLCCSECPRFDGDDTDPVPADRSPLA